MKKAFYLFRSFDGAALPSLNQPLFANKPGIQNGVKSILSLKALISSILLFLTFSISGISQNYEGYTLYFPQGGTKAYLTDMTGATYHTWTFPSNASTTYASYLLADRVLLRTVNHAGNSFTGGPISGEVQKVDWSGAVLWDFVYSTANYCSHHDIHAMPNGNVLLISYERKTATEVTQAGCSQSIEMWPDKIVEIQPSGTNGGTVVWEWHAWDHLVQHYDAAKNNYGVVASHPELLNINYNTAKDWMHMNGIDYNEALDQIVFSSHALNEIYVIDHSTTTAQAATHTGGNSGKGGDFLYRWGNPAAYETAGTADFNVVHDAHWVPSNNPTYPNALCGYNNKGGTGSKTCVDILAPPYNGYNYLLTPGTAFAPSTYEWRYTYTGNQQQDNGNSQQLPNGNTLVCLGMTGLIYELNPSQTQIWSKSVGSTIAQAFRYPPCFVDGNYVATAAATPSSLCLGGSTQLNVTATGGAVYNYSWTSNPAGFTSSLQNPIVSPTVTTVYTVTIKNGPCTAISAVTVTVGNSISATASASPASICPGGSSQLNAVASGGSTYTYSWTSEPAGFTSSLQNPTVSPIINTTYTVAVSSSGCTTTSSTPVSVPAVTASATPSQLCAGTQTQLNALATGGSGFTFAWTSIPAGFTSSLQNPVASPSTTTIYYVTATSGSCSANAQATVTVANPVTVSTTATPSTICSGQNSQLNAAVTGATSCTYSWTSVPAGFTSTLQNPIVNPTTATTYYVTVGNGACTANNSVSVTVNQPFTLQANASPGSVCYNSTSQLSAAVTGSSASINYAWSSNPAGFTSTLQNPVVTPLETTIYTVLASDGTCSVSASSTVNVVGPISVQPTATPQIVCLGQPSQLFADVSGGSAYTYAWTSIPSGFTSTLQNPVVNPSLPTSYLVSVQSAPCSASNSVNVGVNPLPSTPTISHSGDTLFSSAASGNQWYFNSAIMSGKTGNFIVPQQNGSYRVQVTDGNGCASIMSEAYAVTTTSLIEYNNALLIYPNPSSGIIHIEGLSTQTDGLHISVYDFRGSRLTDCAFSETIDLSGFANGMYCMVISRQGKILVSRKISLQK